MRLKLIILLFSLVEFSYLLCLNLDEREGNCTACGTAYQLKAGTCQYKIVGCANFTQSKACAACQFGYVLTKGLCVKQKIAEKLPDYKPNLAVNPNVNSSRTLTYQQILAKTDDGSPQSFSAAHEYLLIHNPKLGKGQIAEITSAGAKTGKYFTIVYYIDNATLYQVSCFVDPNYKVKQLEFKNYSPLDYQFNLVRIAKEFLPSLYEDLTNYNLFQIVKQDEEIFKFYYIYNGSQLIRIVGGVGLAFNVTNLKANFINMSDLALEKILEQNPKWSAEQLKFVERGEQFFAFKRGENTFVTAFFNGVNFVINYPTDPVPESTFLPKQNAIQTADSLVSVGAYEILTDFNQPIITFVLSQTRKRIPQLSTATLTKAYFQIVQGINYILMFTQGPTDYEIRLFLSIARQLTISYASRNRNIFYNEFHPFNQDRIALITYLNFKSQIREFVQEPVIKYMSLVRDGDLVRYRVSYERGVQVQYVYDGRDGSVRPVGFNVSGVNRLGEMLRPDSSEGRKIAIYTDLLTRNFNVFNSTGVPVFYIKSLQQKNSSTDIVTVVTPTGTYNITISNPPTTSALPPTLPPSPSPSPTPTITSTQLLSPSTCTPLNLTLFLTSQKISKAYSLLSENYLLDGYTIEGIDIRVFEQQIMYRFVLVNQYARRILALVEEVFGTGTFNIHRAGYLDQGFDIISNNSTDYFNEYEIMVRMTTSLSWLKKKLPIFTQYNGTLLRSILVETRGSYALAYDQTNQQGEIRPLSLTSFDLISEFYFTRIVYPGVLESAENATINKIMGEIRRLYEGELGNMSYVVVSQNPVNQNYILLLNTTKQGYIITQASTTENRTTIPPYRKTTLKTLDLTNCPTPIDPSTGKCPSCDRTQLKTQHQGSCFKTIQNCGYQVAGYCIRCAKEYVKVGEGCAKDCQTVFV